MKRRQTLNNNAESYTGVVYEDAGRIVVLKHDSHNYYDFSIDERFEFGTVAEYEAWLGTQDWIKPEKTKKIANFQKVPKDSSTPGERYDAVNTTQLKLKLNLKTDTDILKKLEEVGNKQGYIKALIRADIASK